MRKRLTKLARCVIIMRNQESNKVQAVQKLQNDLVNIPLHCFGCHSKCSPDFCKTAQKNNEQQQQQEQQLLPPVQQHSLASSTLEDITDDAINNTGIIQASLV